MASYSNNQSNPGAATPVWFGGALPANYTTSSSFQIDTSPGVFYGLSVNTGGTASTAALYDGLSAVVTITLATPGVISWAAHGLIAGSAVRFTTTGALPTGMTAGTTYYVSTAGLTAGAFQIADTKSHALAGTNSINTSGSQSGVQTGWNVTNSLGTFATTAAGPVGPPAIGMQYASGLLMVAADGGGAANVTVLYR